MVQQRQKDTEIKESSKINLLVYEEENWCNGCCFDFGDGYPKICDFIKCTSGERTDMRAVIFKIEQRN